MLDDSSTDVATPWLIETSTARYVTLLGGHGGSGKSLLALTWAVHVSVRRAWGGLSVCRGKSIRR